MSSKPLKPFITDADDLFSFDNIEVMKQEIQAVSGIQYNQMIRLYRFEGTDKARIHYRIISKENDGTGVPVQINMSKDPTKVNMVSAFANIAVGFPYYVPEGDGSSQLVYWDGTRNVVVGQFSVSRSIMPETDFYRQFKGSTGFYPTTTSTNGEPVYIQYIKSGEVDNNISVSSLKVEPAGVVDITLDKSQSASATFKVTPKPDAGPSTVQIYHNMFSATILVKGGAR